MQVGPTNLFDLPLEFLIGLLRFCHLPPGCCKLFLYFSNLMQRHKEVQDHTIWTKRESLLGIMVSYVNSDLL